MYPGIASARRVKEEPLFAPPSPSSSSSCAGTFSVPFVPTFSAFLFPAPLPSRKRARRVEKERERREREGTVETYGVHNDAPRGITST